MLDDVLTELHTKHFAETKAWLSHAFSEVDDSALDDIVSESLLKTTERSSRDDLPPIGSHRAYLRTCARNSALDFVSSLHRTAESRTLDQLEGHCGVDHQGRAYRQRQGVGLSGIYREFVQYCQDRGGVWNRRKELIERILMATPQREQMGGASLIQLIVNSMVKSGHYPDNCTRAEYQFQADRRRAADEIQRIMQEHDVHRTMFESVWDSLGEKYQDNRQLNSGSQSGKRSSGDSFQDSGGIDVGALPEVRNFHDLARWIAAHTNAFCPSAERLQQYFHAGASAAIQGTLDGQDIYYHVVERECRFCNVLISATRDTGGSEEA